MMIHLSEDRELLPETDEMRREFVTKLMTSQLAMPLLTYKVFLDYLLVADDNHPNVAVRSVVLSAEKIRLYINMNMLLNGIL